MPLKVHDKKLLKKISPRLMEIAVKVQDLTTWMYANNTFTINTVQGIENMHFVNDSRRMVAFLEYYQASADTLNELKICLKQAGHEDIAQELETQSPDGMTTEPTGRLIYELKAFYVMCFQKFSLLPCIEVSPFAIEDVCIDLKFKDDSRKPIPENDDYKEYLNSAFQGDTLVVIEGESGAGKTTFMRKIAFDWANGNLQYDLVLCARLREVVSAESVLDIGWKWLKARLPYVDWKILQNTTMSTMEVEIRRKQAHTDNQENKLHTLLVLDGLDESTVKCEELDRILGSLDSLPFHFDVLLTCRPRVVDQIVTPCKKIVIKSFEDSQQLQYVERHFKDSRNEEEKVQSVLQLLQQKTKLKELGKNPLRLAFICIANQHLPHVDSLSAVYKSVIYDVLRRGVGENKLTKRDLQPNWMSCELVQSLGNLALDGLLQKEQKIEFTTEDLHKYNLIDEQGLEVCCKAGLLVKKFQWHHDIGWVVTHLFWHKEIQVFFAAVRLFYDLQHLPLLTFSVSYTAPVAMFPSIPTFHLSDETSEALQINGAAIKMATQCTGQRQWTEALKFLPELVLLNHTHSSQMDNTAENVARFLVNEMLAPHSITSLSIFDTTHKEVVAVSASSFENLQHLMSPETQFFVLASLLATGKTDVYQFTDQLMKNVPESIKKYMIKPITKNIIFLPFLQLLIGGDDIGENLSPSWELSDDMQKMKCTYIDGLAALVDLCLIANNFDTISVYAIHVVIHNTPCESAQAFTSQYIPNISFAALMVRFVKSTLENESDWPEEALQLLLSVIQPQTISQLIIYANNNHINRLFDILSYSQKIFQCVTISSMAGWTAVETTQLENWLRLNCVKGLHLHNNDIHPGDLLTITNTAKECWLSTYQISDEKGLRDKSNFFQFCQSLIGWPGLTVLGCSNMLFNDNVVMLEDVLNRMPEDMMLDVQDNQISTKEKESLNKIRDDPGVNVKFVFDMLKINSVLKRVVNPIMEELKGEIDYNKLERYHCNGTMHLASEEERLVFQAIKSTSEAQTFQKFTNIYNMGEVEEMINDQIEEEFPSQDEMKSKFRKLSDLVDRAKRHLEKKKELRQLNSDEAACLFQLDEYRPWLAENQALMERCQTYVNNADIGSDAESEDPGPSQFEAAQSEFDERKQTVKYSQRRRDLCNNEETQTSINERQRSNARNQTLRNTTQCTAQASSHGVVSAPQQIYEEITQLAAKASDLIDTVQREHTKLDVKVWKEKVKTLTKQRDERRNVEAQLAASGRKNREAERSQALLFRKMEEAFNQLQLKANQALTDDMEQVKDEMERVKLTCNRSMGDMEEVVPSLQSIQGAVQDLQTTVQMLQAAVVGVQQNQNVMVENVGQLTGRVSTQANLLQANNEWLQGLPDELVNRFDTPQQNNHDDDQVVELGTQIRDVQDTQNAVLDAIAHFEEQMTEQASQISANHNQMMALFDDAFVRNIADH